MVDFQTDKIRDLRCIDRSLGSSRTIPHSRGRARESAMSMAAKLRDLLGTRSTARARPPLADGFQGARHILMIEGLHAWSAVQQQHFRRVASARGARQCCWAARDCRRGGPFISNEHRKQFHLEFCMPGTRIASQQVTCLDILHSHGREDPAATRHIGRPWSAAHSSASTELRCPHGHRGRIWRAGCQQRSSAWLAPGRCRAMIATISLDATRTLRPGRTSLWP